MSVTDLVIGRGRGLRISQKDTTEIGRFIRGKKVRWAKKRLEDILEKKTVVPYDRYTEGVGMRPGGLRGRYPAKATKEVLRVLKNAEKNAAYSGLDEEVLIVARFICTPGATYVTPKRQRGREMKSAHLEIGVKEA